MSNVPTTSKNGLHINNKQKDMEDTIRVLKSRDTPRTDHPTMSGLSRDFLPAAGIPKASEHNGTCLDYTSHGRCLGYHLPRGLPQHNQTLVTTSKKPKPKKDFNQSLNSSVSSLGHMSWINHLNVMPTWTVKTYLDTCSQTCRINEISVHRDPVGERLNDLINESMREQPSSLVVVPQRRVHNSSALLMPPPRLAAPRKGPQLVSTFIPTSPQNLNHTTRVRIQNTTLAEHSFTSPQLETNRVVHLSVQSITLEGWQLMREDELSDKVCVRGRHTRSRKTWRSTAITRRISPRSLQTASGTVYHVVGKMSNKDNVMPVFIEEKFAGGFPSDWKDLVKKWIKESDSGDSSSSSRHQSQNSRTRGATSKSPPCRPLSRSQTHSSKTQRSSHKFAQSGTDSEGETPDHQDADNRSHNATKRAAVKCKSETVTKPETSKRENTSKKVTKPKNVKTVNSSRFKNVNTAKRGAKRASASKVVFSEEEYEEDKDDPEWSSKPDHNCTVVIKKLNEKELKELTPTKKKSNTVSNATKKWLHNWRLDVSEIDHNRNFLKVRGVMTNKNGQHLEDEHVSSWITRRVDPCHLEADDGTHYYLEGSPLWTDPQNGEDTAQPEVKKKFAKGFPYNWVAVVQDSQKELNNLQVPSSSSSSSSTTAKQSAAKSKARQASQGKKKSTNLASKKEVESEQLCGIKINVSSRGRKIIQPLKYWESEKLFTTGNRIYLRQNVASEQIVTSIVTPNKNHKTSEETAEKKAPSKEQPRKRKELDDPEPKKDPIKAKKPRVAKPPKEPKQAKEKPQKAAAPATLEDPSSAVNGKKGHTKAKDSSDLVLDEDEIRDIMSKPPKTIKQRQMKERVMKSLHAKNAHTEQDLFASSCSGLSSDGFSDDSFWDADSVSSKVTSDDDRMKFNYTPPGARMGQLVTKISPNKVDVSMAFDGKERDRRTLGFVQRQLNKPKNLLTKKQRDDQKAAASSSTKLMQYKTADPLESRMANAMYNQLTGGAAMAPEVAKFFKPVLPSSQGQDSDSSVEKYYTDDEDAEDIFS